MDPHRDAFVKSVSGNPQVLVRFFILCLSTEVR
jgi:hypothetical protein